MPQSWVFLLFFASANCLNKVLMGQSLLYGIAYLSSSSNVSKCYQDLNLLYEDIEAQKTWALKVLDASGTPSSGFFFGNNLWLGAYDQCRELHNRRPFEISYKKIQVPEPTPFDYPRFEMGFHVAYIKHNSTMQQHLQMPLEWIIQVGVCTPLSCTAQELVLLIEDYLNHNFLTVQKLYNLSLNLTSVRFVEVDSTWIFRLPKTQILLAFVGTFAVLGIIGTWISSKTNKPKSDLAPHQSSIFVEMLKCFALLSNIKGLVKADRPSGSIRCLHGVKFLGMLWVILVHSAFYEADFLTNLPYAFRLSEFFLAQILSNATYCVDTYFFISGFLLAYLFYKHQQSNSISRIGTFCMMFLNRFLRLTGPYVVTILWADVMYTYYRKNSVLYTSEMVDQLCPKYWWRNLLFINNLFPRSEMCLTWSWYLSADTQFFVIGLALLFLSKTYLVLAVFLTFLLILVNILSVALISYSVKYIPTLDEQLRSLDAIYDLPWCRIGPYLTGVITAHIYVVQLKEKLILKQKTKTLFWCLFPLPNLWILFTLYTRRIGVEFSAIYMGISRSLWGVGLGWLVIACCTGNAKILDKFLGFSAWVPLSRLTYCAYLLNPLVANMVILAGNSPLVASTASLSLVGQGVVMITFAMSFLLSTLVEWPSLRLTKLLLKRMSQRLRKNGV